jgi:hypothetical protein
MKSSYTTRWDTIHGHPGGKEIRIDQAGSEGA